MVLSCLNMVEVRSTAVIHNQKVPSSTIAMITDSNLCDRLRYTGKFNSHGSFSLCVTAAYCLINARFFFQNFFKHYQSLGGWSWVLNDYYEEDIFAYMDQPVAQELADIVDPYGWSLFLNIMTS